MPFERVMGALAFSALVVLIILYLRRPKPTEQVIPSLMFFVSERGSTRFHSFLRKFINNFLFFLQFLALGVLAFSVMEFFLELPADKTGNTVIVLDVSASMQAGTPTRFERAVGHADEFLEGKVSIVLAANVPRIALEDGSAESARKLLRAAEPLDTSSNIGDAILLATDLLGGKGEIIVLSDFIATEGIDPVIAKRIASQHAVVRFINLADEVDNVGIISMDTGKSSVRVAVKNFNDAPQSVPIKVFNNGLRDEKTITLPANSIEEFSFDTLPGRTEVRLGVDDDLPADNAAYVSVPHNVKADVLLITSADSSNLEIAFSVSPGVNLDVARPPVINRFGYDIIILHDFEPDLILSGHYRSIESVVRNGTSLVITAQENMPEIGLLPVTIEGVTGASRNVVEVSNFFTEGIDFGVNERTVKTLPEENALTFVSADGPVLSIADHESGKVVYYGILDEYSTFKNSPAYPQFWRRLTDFLTKTENLDDFNFRTGHVEVVSMQTVDTPLGKQKTDRILFDRAGYYSYGGITASASLLNARESSAGANASEFSDEEKQITIDPSELREKRNFTQFLALLAGLLIFLELIYVKFRGDL